MKNRIDTLRKLLELLYKEQESDWSYDDTLTRRKPSANAREVWERQYWPSIQQREIEKWLSTSNESNKINVDFTEKRRFLYLPPLEKNADFVPILSLKCVSNKKKIGVRLRVMLVRHGEKDKKLYGIGFRLDSPENLLQDDLENEGNDKGRANEKVEGRHDFYHAQLIRGFGFGPKVKVPNWLPCTQPSFPLLAYDPATLVFSLLLTLYGKKYCVDLYNRHKSGLPDFGKYLKELDH